MKIEKNCSTCGKTIKVFPSRIKPLNFCSRPCADQAQNTLTNVQSAPWSEEEIVIVRENYQALGPIGCVPLLAGREKGQVIRIAQKIGLKSDRAPAVGMSEAWVRRFWRQVEKPEEGGCWNWMANITAHGYGSVRFTPGKGIHKTLGTHKVAWELTKGPVEAGKYVLHSCGNRRCCNPAHLRLGTAQDNADDRDRDGNTARGEGHYSARLTEKDVVAIRRMARGGVSLYRLAKVFDMEFSNVRAAAIGQTWAHVPEPPIEVSPPKNRKYAGTRHGSEHGNAKLDEEKVQQIRQMAGDGYTQQQIADNFGISQACARHVIIRKTWKHVPEPPLTR